MDRCPTPISTAPQVLIVFKTKQELGSTHPVLRHEPACGWGGGTADDPLKNKADRTFLGCNYYGPPRKTKPFRCPQLGQPLFFSIYPSVCLLSIHPFHVSCQVWIICQAFE